MSNILHSFCWKCGSRKQRNLRKCSEGNNCIYCLRKVKPVSLIDELREK